jgi:hypothetical protein
MHNELYVQLCAYNGEGIRIRRTEINVVLGRVGNGAELGIFAVRAVN